MQKISAGLLMYRVAPDGNLEVLLVHPGGPFWRNKDAGAWTVPKGEIGTNEEPLAAAKREFEEETSIVPSGSFLELTPVRQKAGKIVRAWAFAGDCDPTCIRSNTVQLEWPSRSGRTAEFPEVDRAAFFRIDEARQKINPAQSAFLDELATKLRSEGVME